MIKHIAFLINSLDHAGGTERVVTNIANELIKDSSYKVTIITLVGNKNYFELDRGIDVIHLSNNSRSNLFFDSINLVKLINSKNFDSLVGVSITKLNVWLGFISILFKNKIQLIASDHINFSQSTKILRFLKHISYKNFDSIVVLTHFDQKLMTKLGYKNVIQIPNASSFFPELRDIKPLEFRLKRIIAVGRLENQKGFDLLIEAWSKIHQRFPDWELVIFGEGSLREILDKNIREVAQKDGGFNCYILPFTKTISQELNSSQIFALSSRFEGYPMVLVESLTYGCPIVSFDCETGPKEIFENGIEGILVSAEDTGLFSIALDELIGNYTKRELFFQNILDRREKFKMSNVIKDWKRIFNC